MKVDWPQPELGWDSRTRSAPLGIVMVFAFLAAAVMGCGSSGDSNSVIASPDDSNSVAASSTKPDLADLVGCFFERVSFLPARWRKGRDSRGTLRHLAGAGACFRKAPQPTHRGPRRVRNSPKGLHAAMTNDPDRHGLRRVCLWDEWPRRSGRGPSALS